MAISSLLTDIHNLERPNTASEQIRLLKNLKNELVGHPQRKQDAVQHGIVDVIAHVLADVIKSRGKKRTNETNGAAYHSPRPSVWSDEDELQQQLVVLVGVLVRGGPAFLESIPKSSIPRLLVESLRTNQSSRLRLTILRTLNAFVEASRHVRPDDPLAFAAMSFDNLLSTNAISTYVEILSHRVNSAASRQQIELMSRFINSICQTEQHRSALLSGGVLDVLASRLTAYCFCQNFWKQDISQKFWLNANPAYIAALPPAPTSEAVPWILAAVANIIGESRYRAARLLYSPLAPQFFEIGISPRLESYSSTLVDSSLPQIPTTLNKEETAFPKIFPVLGSLQLPGKHTFTEVADNRASNVDKATTTPDTNTSLVAWLIYTLREEQGLTRVFAAELLAVLLHTGFVTKSRERMLALLVVPLLTQMVDDYTQSDLSSLEKRVLSERTPLVLAMLIKESPLLQKAAVEASLVERAGKKLKATFQSIPAQRPPWTAVDAQEQSTQDAPTRRVGSPGLPEYMVARLKVRENVLILISAIANKDDKYRKSINEQGIVPYIIDSLTPLDENLVDHLMKGTWPDDEKSSELGNPVPILIAACNAIRALSRSVSILRTSLIDAGTAKPAFNLLTHTNLDVVVAATDVMCNLLVEFSPMRAELQDLGVMKHLCKHAHSADSRVRLGSLWALKHFVQANTKEVKVSCFEELGTGWLVQIITGGSPGNVKPKTHSQTASLGAANAAGERVDILNAMDEPMDTNETNNVGSSMDDPMDAENSDANLSTSPSNQAPIYEPHPWLAARNQAHLQEILNQELQQICAAPQRTELEIQVQGLDFIRNFMLAPGAPGAAGAAGAAGTAGTAGAGELIDCVFNTLGSARIFQIILDKLKPPVTTGSDATSSSSSPPPPQQDQQQPQQQHNHLHAHQPASPSPFPPTTHPSLLESAIFIICHIAGGTATHRTMLTSQHLLLRALLPHFKHPAPSVRVVCVWTVISLTWVDDEADAVGARQRAFELRGLGFESALRALQADESVDVKERVRLALTQLADLVDGVGAGASSGVGGSSSAAAAVLAAAGASGGSGGAGGIHGSAGTGSSLGQGVSGMGRR